MLRTLYCLVLVPLSAFPVSQLHSRGWAVSAVSGCIRENSEGKQFIPSGQEDWGVYSGRIAFLAMDDSEERRTLINRYLLTVRVYTSKKVGFTPSNISSLRTHSSDWYIWFSKTRYSNTRLGSGDLPSGRGWPSGPTRRPCLSYIFKLCQRVKVSIHYAIPNSVQRNTWRVSNRAASWTRREFPVFGVPRPR